MSILEDDDDEVECVTTHIDLLPAPKKGDQMLASNSVLLKTVLQTAGTSIQRDHQKLTLCQ